MFNNPYVNAYNPQSTIDRINSQIAELERQKSQVSQPIQQPTNLTQNFQLAPTNRDVIRYANSINDVERDMVLGDTPYFSKDMSVVWVKNTQNQIKTYELNEIVPKDEKDLQIELLQAEIDELKKGMIANEQCSSNVSEPKVETNTTRNDETNGTTIKESKSTSVPRVSTSKKR